MISMKIHFLGDSARMNSGYAIVIRNLAIGLKRLGYDVSTTGLQTAYVPEYFDNSQIQVMPIQSDKADEIGQFMNNIQNVTPDYVIYVGNLGDMDSEVPSLAKIYPGSYVYVPINGRDVPLGIVNDLNKIVNKGGKVIAMCKYGYDEMVRSGVNVDRYIYHGYDDKVFREIDIKSVKSGMIVSILKWGNTDDGKTNRWAQYDIEISKVGDLLEYGKRFIYLHVGQNIGIRKRQERLLTAYSIMIKESKQLKDRTHLHMHCLPISGRGLNLIEVIMKLGIQENVSFSYGSYLSAGWNPESLNILYNLADVHVSASSSEGFCVLPDSPILTLDRGVQKIKDIKVGDKVLTHKGRFMRVSQVMSRQYNGDMIKIIPHKLRIPIVLTSEHRVLGVKTQLCTGQRNKGGNIICRQGIDCYYNIRGHRYKYCGYTSGEEPYTRYKIEWIKAKDLEIGDFVLYPKTNEKEIDIEKIRLSDYIDDSLNVVGDIVENGTKQMDLFGDYIKDTMMMNNAYSHTHSKIFSEFILSKDVMKLFGYFIAEGYVSIDNSRIQFAFHIKEDEYISDVERIMRDTFGLDCTHIIKGNSHILDYHNTILGNMFENMFCSKEYEVKKGKGRKANVVRIPPEFLNLPKEKLVELVKGIWRGDGSDTSLEYNITTTSETLAWQLVYILSKFNILASIRSDIRKGENNSLEYRIMVYGKDINIIDKMLDYRNFDRDDIKEGKSKYIKGKNYFYVQISDIEIIKHNGEVWNLEVEEDNSYVSSIIVHNCLPVLEGFATGLPMIAPNCTSFTELIGDGEKEPSESRGYLALIESWYMEPSYRFKPLVDQEHLAVLMKKIYVDNERRELFAKNGIKWVKDFRWSEICKNWDKLLGSI